MLITESKLYLMDYGQSTIKTKVPHISLESDPFTRLMHCSGQAGHKTEVMVESIVTVILKFIYFTSCLTSIS